MNILTGVDIDRDLTLQEVIDDLTEKTDWLKFEAMMVEIDEPEFVIQIQVIKKEVHGES